MTLILLTDFFFPRKNKPKTKVIIKIAKKIKKNINAIYAKNTSIATMTPIINEVNKMLKKPYFFLNLGLDTIQNKVIIAETQNAATINPHNIT